ncbi:MAG TPA: integrase arm-type DNA-binding domain-containing protein [Acidobacteriaceae bacterium]|jgi:integrase
MALSEFALKAVKPNPSRRYYIRDGQGLWLEVFPSGSMAWRYRYSQNGKPGKVALGKYPAVSLKAARKRRDEYAEMLAHGKSPAAHKQAAKVALADTTTVFEFGERYFKEIVQRDRKDPSGIRSYLDKDIYPRFADRAVKDIAPADVQSLVFRKRDNGHPAAAGQLRSLLKRMFEYAVANGLVQFNPAASLPMRFVAQARSRDRALSATEIRLYIEGIYQSNIRRQFKLASHVILLTLVRKSELLLARWEHVDFEAGEWTIPADNSKTGKPHIVYLARQTGELFRELKQLAGNSALVLPGRGSLIRPFASNALNKALDGVSFEMKAFTIHDLRRTGATHLHEQGFPSDVVEKALNHTIGGVRGVYNRAQYSDQRRQMLQHWADYVESLATEHKVIIGNFNRASQ